jgi:hypothetical protein
LILLTHNYLRFTIASSGPTSVRIYNLKGRVVATPLQKSHLKAGTHGIPLGKKLPGGIYIVAVRGSGFSITRKLEVVR